PDQDKGGSDDLGYPVEQGEDHSPDKPTLSAPHELDNCVVEVVDLLVSPREEFLDTAVLPGFGKEERAAVDHPLYHVGPPDCQVEEEQASCHEYPGDKDHDLRDSSEALPLVGQDNHGKRGKPCKCNTVEHPLHDHDSRGIPERDVCLIEFMNPYGLPSRLGRRDRSGKQVCEDQVQAVPEPDGVPERP